MAYNAIIHGARGIAYYGNFYLPINSITWTNTKSMATELNGISDALISDLSFRTVTVNNTNVETVLFKRGSGLFLIAANKGTSTASVNIQISGLPLSSAARTAGESGNLTISSNSFSDSFSAYQVHVYNLN